MQKALILCGLPKSGKTTIGKLIAQKLAWPFFDTDACIESAYLKNKQVSLSCREIFIKEGEEFFRKLEREQISLAKKGVIATGGGSILDEQNRELLKKLGLVYFLSVPLAILWERMQTFGIPAFLQSEESLHLLAKERLPLYENASHVTIATSQLTPSQIVDVIIEDYGQQ